MIVSLTGKIVSYSNGELHLDVNGVGYGISVSKSIASLPLQPGNELTVLTHLDVKENSMLLFGFSDEREREIFKLLLTVSGVGTKIGSYDYFSLKLQRNCRIDLRKYLNPFN